MYGCERTGCEVKALQRSLPDEALSIVARRLWPRIRRVGSPRPRIGFAVAPFQSIPIKMKSPTSVRKVTLMIATVRNTSLAERGFMNASHLAKPRE